MVNHTNSGFSANPVRLLKGAIRIVPEVKYAFGVVGIAAAVAIVLGIIRDPKIAFFGIAIMLALMFILVIFANAVKDIPGITWLAALLAWTIAILFVATLITVFTSLAFGVPKTFAQYLTGKSSQDLHAQKDMAPPFLHDVVAGSPLGKCRADPQGSGVQLFEHGWLLVRFKPIETLYAIVKTSDGRVSWFRKKSEWEEGKGERECAGVEGEHLLQWAFRWWYCSPDAKHIRTLLGKPQVGEVPIWAQFQDWSAGLLVVGLPGERGGIINGGRFERLCSIFLARRRAGTRPRSRAIR